MHKHTSVGSASGTDALYHNSAYLIPLSAPVACGEKYQKNQPMNIEWIAETALSASSSLISTEILISLVEIILMLM